MEEKLPVFLLCLGSFYVHFCSFGLAVSFGILFVELLDKYGGNVAETTWLPSLYTGVSFLVGPLSGAIAKRYGVRRAAIGGSLLMTCGMLSSAFVPSLQWLLVTFGVLGGIGSSVMHLCGHVIIVQHFSKWRSLMAGIAGSGISVASMTLPLLTKATIEEYGIEGTFFILAGFTFQGVAAAATFIPPVSTESSSKHKENRDSKTFLDKIKSCKNTVTFCSIPFVLFCCSWAALIAVYFIPYLYLPEVALSRGLSLQDATYTASALGLGNIFGRFVFTSIGDIKRLDKMYLHIPLTVLHGIISLLYVFISDFTGLIVLGVCMGLVSSTLSGLQPVIIADLVDVQDMELAYGFFLLSISITAVLGQPAAGALIDSTGTFSSAFYCCFAVSILSAIFAAIIPCVRLLRHGKDYSISNVSAKDTIVVYSVEKKIYDSDGDTHM